MFHLYCHASVICRAADDQQDITNSMENVSLHSAVQRGECLFQLVCMDYYYPRESEGICFYWRWFVCVCVCL